MNRMKATDIKQLRYLFDMYYCVFYNKNIIENDFLVPIISGKNGTKDTTKETEVKYCK